MTTWEPRLKLLNTTAMSWLGKTESLTQNSRDSYKQTNKSDKPLTAVTVLSPYVTKLKTNSEFLTRISSVPHLAANTEWIVMRWRSIDIECTILSKPEQTTIPLLSSEIKVLTTTLISHSFAFIRSSLKFPQTRVVWTWAHRFSYEDFEDSRGWLEWSLC